LANGENQNAVISEFSASCPGTTLIPPIIIGRR
jgi:hypothetical protein